VKFRSRSDASSRALGAGDAGIGLDNAARHQPGEADDDRQHLGEAARRGPFRAHAGARGARLQGGGEVAPASLAVVQHHAVDLVAVDDERVKPLLGHRNGRADTPLDDGRRQQRDGAPAPLPKRRLEGIGDADRGLAGTLISDHRSATARPESAALAITHYPWECGPALESAASECVSAARTKPANAWSGSGALPFSTPAEALGPLNMGDDQRIDRIGPVKKPISGAPASATPSLFLPVRTGELSVMSTAVGR
jgi:hypothetical protein